MMDEDLETGEPRLDHETGESRLDHETGEKMISAVGQTCTNAETGEPELVRQGLRRKTTFQVRRTVSAVVPAPVGNKLTHVTSTVANLFSDFPQPFTTPCHGSQNIRSIVFMLPTLFLFPAWTTVLAIICELCIHTWAHKRNKALRNHGIMYRSPLHIFTSTFCAYCRSDALMQKIGKMQDKRKLRADIRKIHYCAYVERLSVVT